MAKLLTFRKKIKYTLALLWKFFTQYNLAFRTTKFMEEYFFTWKTLHRKELFKGKEDDKAFQLKRFVSLWSVYTVMAVVVFRCLQYAILALFGDTFSDHTRIILWDQMYFLGIEASFNLPYSMYSACLIVFFRMYFYGNPRHQERETVWLVFNALNEGDKRKEFQHPLLFVKPEVLQKVLYYLIKVMEIYGIYFGMYIFVDCNKLKFKFDF